MMNVIRKIQRMFFDHDPSFCDMYEDAPAHAGGEEYLGHIRRHLHERFSNQPLSILDAGCQAGRLLIPLANDGHRVIGLDASLFALRRAHRHAKAHKLSITLHRGNLTNLRRWIPPASVDVVVCAEVLYLCQNYRQLLQLLADSVKPGGLLFVSHRPTLYYVACALRSDRSDQLPFLMTQIEGPSTDGAYHNWQTSDQLIELYQSLNLDLLASYQIQVKKTPLTLSPMVNSAVRRFLEPVQEADSLYRIPTYFLVVAQRMPSPTGSSVLESQDMRVTMLRG